MTAPRQFVRFREVNDHEGETWNFWLQVDGNEEELAQLGRLLAAADVDSEDGLEEEQYALCGDVEPEPIVDKLVAYAEVGYHRTHQKVTGRLVCPADLGEHADDLYKGGIRDLFTTETGS